MTDSTQQPECRSSGPSTLVVDAANVVGSVPDGWWRDRQGAAARLHAGLSASLRERRLPFERIVLVLEGQARRGVQAGEEAGVTTVHSPGSCDDTIVERCRDLLRAGDAVTLATADRGLIDRVGPDVALVGPRSLRDQLEQGTTRHPVDPAP